MALKLSEHASPKHHAPEMPPFQAAAYEKDAGQPWEAIEVEASVSPEVVLVAMERVVYAATEEPQTIDMAVPGDPASFGPSPLRWRSIDTAPMDRPIYTTADPEIDPDGTLTYWRRSREKIIGVKGWRRIEYWASVLTNRALEFEPAMWRESMVQKAPPQARVAA